MHVGIELYDKHANVFLKLLNAEWKRTEKLTSDIAKYLEHYGIKSGTMLDLFCGNGRISVYMAKLGYKAVAVDAAQTFLKDGKQKAEQNGVSNSVTFVNGDVRTLKEVIHDAISREILFDVIVNGWTSLGMYSRNEDVSILKQARDLSKEGAFLFITETMHENYVLEKFAPSSYFEIEDLIFLEKTNFDRNKKLLNRSWAFYRKQGSNDLVFMGKTEFDLHIYTLSELSSILEEAGWQLMMDYGSLSKSQSLKSSSLANIAARAAN